MNHSIHPLDSPLRNACVVMLAFAQGCAMSFQPGPEPVTDVPPAFDGAPDPIFDGAACGDAGSASVDVLPLTFHATTSSTRPVVPISGGTLLVSRDQRSAIVSDPENDAIDIVDLGVAPSLRTRIALTLGDEPGRIVEDDAQIAHVVLRRGGAVVDVDIRAGTLLRRRAVCAAPRGIAYVPTDGTLRVACVDGTLATLSAAGGPANATLVPYDDLRDVVFDATSNKLAISRFRSAQVIEVDPVSSVATPPRIPERAVPSGGHAFVPDVAWRMIADPSAGGVILLHQLAAFDAICPQPGGYGGATTGPIVDVAVSSGPLPLRSPDFASRGNVALAVDIAVSPDASQLALAIAGAVSGNSMPRVLRINRTGTPQERPPLGPILGQPVAVAFKQTGELLVLTRDPVALYVDVLGSESLLMLGESPRDTGHEIFHAATGGGLACAGCHPEGGDDGRVWNFGGIGARRTQNLRGGIIATAPFHWDGRFSDVASLLTDVYHGRMSGPALASNQMDAVASWLDTIAPIPMAAPSDAGAAARGRTMFNDSVLGCATCHVPPAFTNNVTMNVGTGEMLQVPSLRGVAFRAPYMHNGCAPTLRDRFTNPACGGGDSHGHTSQLTDAQIGDLVAYLQTL